MKTQITKIATETIRQWGNGSVTVRLPKIFQENQELYAGKRVTYYLANYKRQPALLIVPEDDVRLKPKFREIMAESKKG
jgi:antitoxin component of MazEF toxin-antitoxin module